MKSRTLVTLGLTCMVAVGGLALGALGVSAKTEITFLYQGESTEIGPGSFTDRIIKAFEKKYPQIKVKLNASTGGSAYYDKLLSMMAGGVMADVFYCDPNQFYIFGKNGLAEDLRPYLKTSPYDPLNAKKYVQTALKLGTVNGKVIASTPHGGMMVWYYNRDMFDQAGLVPPPASYDEPAYKDWTWQALEETGRKLSAFGQAKKVTGVAISSWFLSNYNWVRLAGGQIYDDMNAPKRSMLDSASAVEALQFLQESNQKKTTLLGGDTSAFMSGKVGLINDGAWSIANIKQANKGKGLNFKWDVTVYPYNPRNYDRRGTIWYQDGFMLFKGSKKKDAASKFLMFLLFDPEAQKVAAEEGVGIPLMRSMNTSKAYLESMPAGAAHWGDTLDRFISYEPCVKNQDRLWTTLQTVVDQLKTNKKGFAQIAKEAADKVNILLK